MKIELVVTSGEIEKGEGKSGEEVQTIKYKISHKDIVQCREYSQYFIITINGYNL